MGFGSIASQMILFIAMVTIAGALVIHMRTYTSQTSTSLEIQKDRLVEQLQTDVTIQSVSFTNTTNPHTVTVYVKNTGKTRLELNETDIFVSGNRYQRTERNLTIEADTEIANPWVWDPKEVLQIQAYRNISGGTHTVLVSTANGINDEDIFST